MRCVTYNLWHGGLGLDGAADRWPDELALLHTVQPDLVLLVSASLADRVVTHAVLPAPDGLSDHLPVLVELDLAGLG